jgi:hypothetical protein
MFIDTVVQGVRRSGRDGLSKAFAILILASMLTLSACGEKSASDTALQGGDVSGLHRCSLSGSIKDAIGSKTWSDLQAGGAQEAAYVEYVTSDSDCGANPPSGKVALNIVVKFDSEQHATAAYQSGGLTGGGAPSSSQYPGAQLGHQTGLGDNSIIISYGSAADAIWSAGKYYSLLSLYSGGVLELRDIAGKVKARE